LGESEEGEGSGEVQINRANKVQEAIKDTLKYVGVAKFKKWRGATGRRWGGKTYV